MLLQEKSVLAMMMTRIYLFGEKGRKEKNTKGDRQKDMEKGKPINNW